MHCLLRSEAGPVAAVVLVEVPLTDHTNIDITARTLLWLEERDMTMQSSWACSVTLAAMTVTTILTNLCAPEATTNFLAQIATMIGNVPT